MCLNFFRYFGVVMLKNTENRFFYLLLDIFGLCRLIKGSYVVTDGTIVFYAKKYTKNLYNSCCQYFSAIQSKITTKKQTAIGICGKALIFNSRPT